MCLGIGVWSIIGGGMKENSIEENFKVAIEVIIWQVISFSYNFLK